MPCPTELKMSELGLREAVTDVWLNKDPRKAPRFLPLSVQRKVRFRRKQAVLFPAIRTNITRRHNWLTFMGCLKFAAQATLMRLMCDRNDNQPGRFVVLLLIELHLKTKQLLESSR